MTGEVVANEQARLGLQRAILLGSLVAVAVGFNLFVQPIASGAGSDREFLPIAMIAILITQPSLVAFWVVLSTAPLTRRISLGMAMVLLLSAAAAVGIRQNSGGASHEAVSIACTFAAQTLLSIIVLLPLRCWWGWKLLTVDSFTAHEKRSSQFQLLHVLVWTFQAALFCGFIKVLETHTYRSDLPLFDFERLNRAIATALMGSGLSVLGLVPSWWILGNRRSRVLSAMIFAPLLGLVAVGLFELFTWQSGGIGTLPEIASAIAQLCGGACAGGVFTFFILRSAGYQLVRHKSQSKEFADATPDIDAVRMSAHHAISRRDFLLAALLLFAIGAMASWRATEVVPYWQERAIFMRCYESGFLVSYQSNGELTLRPISDRPLSDVDIQTLTTIRGIAEIDFTGFPLTEEKLNRLRKALPGVKVSSNPN